MGARARVVEGSQRVGAAEATSAQRRLAQLSRGRYPARCRWRFRMSRLLLRNGIGSWFGSTVAGGMSQKSTLVPAAFRGSRWISQ